MSSTGSTYFADLIGMQCIEEAEAFELFQYLLFEPQGEGGKEIWGCLDSGLVTEVETRNVMLAHIQTKIQRVNQCVKFDVCILPCEELNRRMDFALFGRGARVTEVDLDSSDIVIHNLS